MTEHLEQGYQPGGRMDARAQAQYHAAAVDGGSGIWQAEAVDLQKFVLSTRNRPPLQGRGWSVLLGPNNPVLPIIPRDPLRRSAVVLAVDNDVYLSASHGLLMPIAGTTTGSTAFYLPAGIAIPITDEAAWFAAATTLATSSRVSILIELDHT